MSITAYNRKLRISRTIWRKHWETRNAD